MTSQNDTPILLNDTLVTLVTNSKTQFNTHTLMFDSPFVDHSCLFTKGPSTKDARQMGRGWFEISDIPGRGRGGKWFVKVRTSENF